MGFKSPRKVYRLVFEDEAMAGLEVRARSLPLGALLDLVDLANLAGRAVTAADKPLMEQLYATFARSLISWNVEDDDGRPVPADLAGVLSLDQDFAMTIITAWQEAIASVPPPLPPTSSGGGPSLEASMSMEPLSPSPVN